MMRREFAQSFALHRAIADKIARDTPGEVAKAKDFLDRHRSHWPANAGGLNL